MAIKTSMSVIREKLYAQRDFGAIGNGTTDTTAALQRFCAALSGNQNAPHGFIEPGNYLVSGDLVVNNSSAVIEGKDSVSTTIHRNNAGDVFRVRNDGSVANVSRNTGRIEGLRFQGNTSAKVHNGFAACVVDGLHWYQVNRVETLWTDIGYDLRNNCYLSQLNQCTTNLGTSHNVGILLRGTVAGGIAGSGSDIEMNNCGFAGYHAGMWVEPNGGGYHMQRGQLTGGSNNVTTNDDGAGALVMSKFYNVQAILAADAVSGATTLDFVDATQLPTSGALLLGNGPTNATGPVVTWTGKTGNQLTGVVGLSVTVPSGTEARYVGAATSVRLNGVSTEGTQRVWVFRSYEGAWSVNFNGTDHLGHGAPDSPLGFMKITRGIWNIGLRGIRIAGSYQAAGAENMVSLTGESNSQNIIVEEGTNGSARLNNTTTYTWDAKPMLSYAADIKNYQQIHARYGRVFQLSDTYLRSDLNGGMQRWDATSATWVPNSLPAGATTGKVLGVDGSGAVVWTTVTVPTLPSGGSPGNLLTLDSGSTPIWAPPAPNELPTGGAAGDTLGHDASGTLGWVSPRPRIVAGGTLGATPSLAVTVADVEVWMTGTLNASATLTVTGLVAGQKVRLLYTQDTTGTNKTLAVTAGGSTTSVLINQGVSVTSIIVLYYDGTDVYVEGP